MTVSVLMGKVGMVTVHFGCCAKSRPAVTAVGRLTAVRVEAQRVIF